MNQTCEHLSEKAASATVGEGSLVTALWGGETLKPPRMEYFQIGAKNQDLFSSRTEFLQGSPRGLGKLLGTL